MIAVELKADKELITSEYQSVDDIRPVQRSFYCGRRSFKHLLHKDNALECLMVLYAIGMSIGLAYTATNAMINPINYKKEHINLPLVITGYVLAVSVMGLGILIFVHTYRKAAKQRYNEYESIIKLL